MLRRAPWWEWFLRPFRRPGPDYTLVIVQRWTILDDDDERLASRSVTGRLYRDGRFVPNDLPGRRIIDDADALKLIEGRKAERRRRDDERDAEQLARKETDDELVDLDFDLPPWEA